MDWSKRKRKKEKDKKIKWHFDKKANCDVAGNELTKLLLGTTTTIFCQKRTVMYYFKRNFESVSLFLLPPSLNKISFLDDTTPSAGCNIHINSPCTKSFFHAYNLHVYMCIVPCIKSVIDVQSSHLIQCENTQPHNRPNNQPKDR